MRKAFTAVLIIAACLAAFVAPLPWMRPLADTAIAAAVWSLAALLFYFSSQRPDVPFRRGLRLFAGFLLAAGAAQFAGLAAGRLETAAKALAAVTGLLIVVWCLEVLPRALALRSPVELDEAKRRLKEQIAERKRAAEKLIRAASFPNQNPNPFIEIDLAGNVTYWNPEARRRLPDFEELGLEHPALAELDAVIRPLLHGEGDSVTREVEVNGAVFQQKICYVARRNHLLVYMVDITDLKQAQEALSRSEERFRGLFEDAPVAYHEIDTQGTIRRVNHAECSLLGFAPAEILGKPAWQFVAPEDKRAAREAVLRRISGEEELVPYTLEYGRRDGARLTIEIHENFTRGPAGGITGMRCALQDITERRRAEQESQRAREAAEAASRAKSEFVANMSHEIRTPLNGIMGMTDLALDTGLTLEQREYLHTIKTSADSLLTVVSDILDFSKIEAGKLEIDPAPFHLRAAVGDALTALAAAAEGKNLELVYGVAPELPDALVGDPGRLRQILLNLIGNAIKFTERGEVLVSVEKDSQAAGEVALRFSVADTGIGIAPEKQQLIFDAFQQADTSTTRRYGGTGLGLTISSRLVELMKGRMSVESEPGKGSTFHFTASFGLQPEVAQVAPAGIAALRGFSVLVIDENATSRRILHEIFATWEMAPAMAESAEAGWSALQAAREQAQPVRLVLINAHLCGPRGFGVLEQIRGLDGSSAPRVILLAAPGEATHWTRRGADACLTKPVHHTQLLNAVLRVFDVPGAPAEPSAAISTLARLEAGDTPLRILLAEDNIVNQTLIRRLLEKAGHTVVVVGNGLEALQALDGQAFDLVLMDVQMPEMGGLECAAAIRDLERAAGGHVPILAMTAHAMAGDRERCLASGMDGYISKPIDTAGLFELIEKLAPGARPPRASAGSWSAGRVNGQTLLSRVGGDPTLMKDLVNLFLSECPKFLSRIGEAVARGDCKALERAAHNLKGSLGNLAATSAADAALKLESAARDGDLQHAERFYALLEDEIGRLGPELEALRTETLT